MVTLPVLLGIISGFAVNLLGAISSPAGVAVVRILPTAVRLALKVAHGKDATADAEDLIKLAPRKVVESERPIIEEPPHESSAAQSTARTAKRSR